MLKLSPSNLKQAFLISRYIQLKDDVRLPENQTMRGQWVVGRSQCLYKVFNLSDIPNKRRKNAITVLIMRWSPFSRTAMHIVWDQAIAMVWIWDGLSSDEKIADIGIQAVEKLPESVFYPRGQNTTTCMPSLDGGYITQIWHQGVLLAEKWWAVPPTEKLWLQFIRGLNIPQGLSLTSNILLDTMLAPPLPIEASELAAKPWGSRNKVLPFVSSLKWEKWLLVGSLGLLSVSMLWQATTTAITLVAVHNVEARIAVVSTKASPVLDAREQSLLSNGRINELLAVVDKPHQRALMASIGETLSLQNARIVEWSYSINKLEIIVEGDKIQTLSLLQALESLSFIKSAALDKAPAPTQYKFVLMLGSHHA